jgi:hypothetical protein
VNYLKKELMKSQIEKLPKQYHWNRRLSTPEAYIAEELPIPVILL